MSISEGNHGQEQIDGGLIFAVHNHHTANCGRPPAIDGDIPGRYCSYFENSSGEQAVFVYDRDSGKATLWLGDCGGITLNQNKYLIGERICVTNKRQ